MMFLLFACAQEAPPVDPATEKAFQQVVLALEEVRLDLTADVDSDRSAVSLREALLVHPWPATLAPHAARAAEAAAHMPATPLDEDRVALQAVNEALVALVAEQPALGHGLHVFACPMVDGFNKWIQPTTSLGNPYMGTAMPTCGSESTWEPGRDEPKAVDPDAIAHWTCPMHPSVHLPEQQPCPLCGMDLVPVTHAELATGAVHVDRVRRQAYGIRTAQVVEREATRPVRGPATVALRESAQVTLTSRTMAWVESVAVEEGEAVRKGQVLARLKSPELKAAQEELLVAHKTGNDTLTRKARDRLQLLGLAPFDIDAVVAQGQALATAPVRAPIDGVVLDRPPAPGMEVGPGMPLLMLADLAAVWVEVDVPARDLPLVAQGQAAVVEFPGLDPRPGTVHAVLPMVDMQTRSARARLHLEDTAGLLPGLVGTARIDAPLGPALLVPVDAVIRSGERDTVFLDQGEGRLLPRAVRAGPVTGAWIVIEEGLQAGDTVVASGVFLVAAESRLMSASDDFGGGHEH